MVVNYKEIIFNKLVDSCRELMTLEGLPCEDKKMLEEMEQKFRYSYLDS
jgi:hypothetical protein